MKTRETDALYSSNKDLITYSLLDQSGVVVLLPITHLLVKRSTWSKLLYPLSYFLVGFFHIAS